MSGVLTFTNVAKVGPNVTSYTVESLKANTKYYFRVRAYRDGLNSAFSNTATATTPR